MNSAVIFAMSAIIFGLIVYLFVSKRKDQSQSNSTDDVSTLQGQLTKAAMDLRRLESENSQLKEINTSARETLASVTGAKETLEKVNSDAAKSYEVLQGQIGQFQSQINLKQNEHTLLREEAAVIKTQLTEAASAIERYKNEAHEVKTQLRSLDSEHRKQQSDLQAERQSTSSLRSANDMMNTSKSEMERTIQAKESELLLKNKKIVELEQQESLRHTEYNERIVQLNQLKESLEKDRQEEARVRKQAIEERHRHMKETWSRHEAEVESKIKLLCQQMSIEYVDKEKYPHSGKPDNAVKICGEYIIFDSKSPQGEDLSNFPTYVKSQAELAKKYAKKENVKKDIFLVVPTNAISEIEETYLSFGEHHAHIITTDSVRTVLIALKKIEEYEFVDKLDPDDRDKIVTFIGKLVHRIKRGIQIDCYLNNDLIALLTEAENLPKDILDGSVKVEKNLILNPTTQRRAKPVDSEELRKDAEKLETKALGQEIYLAEDLAKIESIPLHLAPKAKSG